MMTITADASHRRFSFLFLEEKRMKKQLSVGNMFGAHLEDGP